MASNRPKSRSVLIVISVVIAVIVAIALVVVIGVPESSS
jgi:hypothetical protein